MKYVSGSQKRNKRKRSDELIKSQRGYLDKFFKTKSSVEDVDLIENEDDALNENINFDENDDLDEHDTLNESENDGDDDLDEHVTLNVSQNASLNENNDLNEHDALNENIDLSVLHDLNEYENNGDVLNIFDPRTWDNIDNKTKDILVEKGPLRENNLIFPKDEGQRHFSCTYYTRKLPN